MNEIWEAILWVGGCAILLVLVIAMMAAIMPAARYIRRRRK